MVTSNCPGGHSQTWNQRFHRGKGCTILWKWIFSAVMKPRTVWNKSRVRGTSVKFEGNVSHFTWTWMQPVIHWNTTTVQVLTTPAVHKRGYCSDICTPRIPTLWSLKTFGVPVGSPLRQKNADAVKLTQKWSWREVAEFTCWRTKTWWMTPAISMTSLIGEPQCWCAMLRMPSILCVLNLFPLVRVMWIWLKWTYGTLIVVLRLLHSSGSWEAEQ